LSVYWQSTLPRNGSGNAAFFNIVENMCVFGTSVTS